MLPLARETVRGRPLPTGCPRRTLAVPAAHRPPTRMMRCDAEWLGRTLAGSSTEELSPLLNLGASTRHFRQVEQPYIDELVFRPLEARGVRVIHSDLKAAEGVDLVGDVFDDADFARLKAARPRAVICTHMFEHVRDREELCPPAAGAAARARPVLRHRALELSRAPRPHRHHVPADPRRAGSPVCRPADPAQERARRRHLLEPRGAPAADDLLLATSSASSCRSSAGRPGSAPCASSTGCSTPTRWPPSSAARRRDRCGAAPRRLPLLAAGGGPSYKPRRHAGTRGEVAEWLKAPHSKCG